MSVEDVHVLVVDDDPQAVWWLGRYLMRAGFPVTGCGDGDEAIELLKAHDYDVVVTDLQLPKVNGLALAEWVAKHRPRVRVMVMTAYGSTSVRQACMSQGAMHYLEKPVDPELVVRILRSSADRASFTGSVDGIDLFDYVQLLLLTSRQAVLEVTSQGDERGTIHIDAGSIPHAECGALDGEDAFNKLLSLDGGCFSTLPWRKPDRVTIHRRGDFVLLDAARHKDESKRPTTLIPVAHGSLDGVSDEDGDPIDRAFSGFHVASNDSAVACGTGPARAEPDWAAFGASSEPPPTSGGRQALPPPSPGEAPNPFRTTLRSVEPLGSKEKP